MQHNQRRISKLRLRLGDGSQSRTILARLEDAFNTASLPGLSPNRLVLVRHLDLGHLPASCSNIQLSTRIDEMVRQIASTAICLDRRLDVEADVVWFQDEMQACLVAAERLAEGKLLDKWYWQSLFPKLLGQTPSARHLLVELLLQSAQVAQTGPQLLCRHLLQQDHLETMLTTLEPHHAAQLLQLTGYTPAVMDRHDLPVSATTATLPYLTPAWNATLRHWLQVWGEGDVRFFWLVSCAIQDTNPAQGIKRELSTVQSIIGQFSRRVNRQHPVNNDTWDPQPRDRSSEMNHQENPLSLDQAHSLEQQGRLQETDNPIADNRQQIWPETPTTNHEPQLSAEQTSPASKARHNKNPRKDQQQTDSATIYNRQPSSAMAEQGDYRAGDESHNSPSPAFLDYANLQHTEYAGLPILISLLERLGIESLLQDHEHLIEINFPARLLWSVGIRFGIPAADPAVAFIPEIPQGMSVGQPGFSTPSSWLQMFYSNSKNHLLVQSDEKSNRHILTDSRNRFVLAVWYDVPPAGLRERLENTDRRNSRAFEFTSDLQLLLNTFHLMMGLYLRHSCAMSLHQLVNRPGQIACTNTHLDGVYDAAMVNMGLRKTGLDANPGWVPWLGKVVQFHYRYDDEHYF